MLKKAIIIVSSLVLLTLHSYGQTMAKIVSNPFDYGKTKDIYFISARERDSMNIKTIIELKNNPGRTDDDMADITILTFNEHDGVGLSRMLYDSGSKFIYNMDTIMKKAQFFNGYNISLKDGHLTGFGGGGYGAFDVHEIENSGDTVSYSTVSCQGHCGPASTDTYRKNVFDKNGNVLYTVNLWQDEISLDDSGREIKDSADTLASSFDTAFYSYTQNGLLKEAKEGTYRYTLFPDCFFPNAQAASDNKYRLYVVTANFTDMESYIKNKIGFLPKVLLFEIYHNGVYNFTLNKNNIYVMGSDFLLEE